jgi:glutaconate CoA-transferase, subunit A
MVNKLISMNEAIDRFVNDGDTIVIEGVTHLICFAAGHEIIRQKKRNLTVCRLTPDLIYEQLIGAGCVDKLVFSWAGPGNPGAGPLYALRRAVEEDIPHSIELDEYSHFGMVGRFTAGAAKLPFYPLRSYMGSDLPQVNDNIRKVQCPYTGESLATVPALNPEVTIVHAQRSDLEGNTQIWGLMGVQKEACFAAKNVIVVAEEIVNENLMRSDPDRTLIPGVIVSAVVHEPWGCHPSFAQGYYDRDNEFYGNWRNISKDVRKFNAYLDEWVFGVKDRNEYASKMGDSLQRLKTKPMYCEPVYHGL